MKWQRADEFTQNCFNNWGYNPYRAVLMADGKTSSGVRYDATILKHDNGTFIPCQGGVKLPAVKRMKAAKDLLTIWLQSNCQKV